ncbi:hypothetical protein K431DRAFT_302109 [Polychaeton citri CBS 116435]|uniref:Amino acid transporter transmembrane domain-containing protein n=1 Tax=Polychaeton citri CBS 116435 TaxID=1314669 RepID=A0A9P4QB69_9PEZI|nr:hypothetical protein K431DRAFT_302109 [Polychaeton citri CBS 116435]
MDRPDGYNDDSDHSLSFNGKPPGYDYIKPQARKPHDPNVTFEEYHYYAERTRVEEQSLPKPKTHWKELLFRKKPVDAQHVDDPVSDEKRGDIINPNILSASERVNISEEEWTNASRAFRSASAGACFYLITTDILGPYGVGFALGTLGWGPGIALYTVFGFMAGYSGYLIWHCFLGLDSYEFPVRNYGDLAFRLFGTIPRHVVNVLQSLALILILGQVTIQNGQALSLVSKFRLCYVVCPILFIVAGFFLGQIRTLRNFGIIANLAIWLNLLVIFITMGVISNSPPNYSISGLGSAGSAVDPSTITPNAQGEYPPIRHYGGMPNSNSLVGAINGLLQGVLAYGGAQLFVEFMAEMRRPRDFLKAMWGAQFFIYSVYMIYGCFVYHYQGQYTYQISYQGVSVYGWQTVGNMIALISGLIAAALYSNIGIKVFYQNVLMDICNAPPLISKRGKIIYAIIVPIWWIIAFIIAAAIPDYFGFVSVISAATLMQFTYSFPPMLALGFDIKYHAMKATIGDGFDPATGKVIRNGGSWERLSRGFCRGRWYMNVAHVLYALGALAMAGLGMYAAIEGMIDAFKLPQVTSFSCRSPLDSS